MKKLFLLLLLLQPIIGIGQKIKYNLFVKDPWTGKIGHDLLYYISDGVNRYEIEDTLGTVTLPSTGNYTLNLYYPHLYTVPSDYLVLKISETKSYSDTLTFRRINELIGGLHSGFSGFGCSNLENCNGYIIDYYSNGNKRLEGNFKNGQAIGKLIYYYPSGRKREVLLYDRRGEGIIKQKLLYGENGKEVK